MPKNSFYIKMMTLSAMIFILSCSNDQDDKKVPDATKAAVENAPDSAKKTDTAAIKKDDAPAKPVGAKTIANVKDSSATSATTKIKNADNKIKESKAAKHDSAATNKNVNAAVAKKDNPANNAAANQPANSNAGEKVFVSKYGIIPRNATESNLTVFFNTFPDKHTVIKINFDGPADAEMNSVKMQIIKVLKKSGYVNVQDQSATIEPQRMPKEIHYELQHDGSVVFWVPILSQDQ